MMHAKSPPQLLRAVVAAIIVTGLLLTSLAIGHNVQAQDASEGGVFLPLVLNGGGPSDATPTPTPSPTPSPTPDPDRGPVVNGACPAGTHMMHDSGVFGIIDPDTFDPQVEGWDEYGCYPDQTVDDISCSVNGTAQVIDGVAVCSCKSGFGGQLCELPAPEAAMPAAVVEGLQQSMEYGEVTQLRATNPGVANAAATNAGVWRVEQGNACLLPTRDATDCLSEIATDSEAGLFLQAKNLGQDGEMAVISFTPDWNPQSPAINTVVVQPPGYIPVNGYGRSQLEPVLGALKDFMKSRCVGAGMIGIAHYGNPVGVWGLGKIHGRASSVIFNEDCPDDDVDPHYPEAPNVTYTSPFKIGSISKPVSYAITRWVIKNRLQEWDADVAIVNLGNDRVVSAIRTTDGRLRLDAWQANAAGVEAHLSEVESDPVRDFSMAAVGADRIVTAARTANNELKFTVWQIQGKGQLTLSGENTVADIKQVRVTAISDSRVVTAVKMQDDRLRLMVWDASAGGAPVILGQDVAGRVRDFDIVSAANGEQARVVVGVRTNDHALKLIVWEADVSGALNRVGDIVEPGYIHGVKLAALTDSRIAVAVRTEEKNLKVFVFDLSDANVFSKLDDDDAGATDVIALSRIGSSGFAVALRDQGGNLKVTTWVVDSDQLARRESDVAGPTSALATANIIYGSDTFNSILFVAARTAENTLKIIPWDVTGPTPSRLANDVEGAPIEDYGWSDDDIEALFLLGYDIPEGLLPDRLERLLSQKDDLPAFDPPIGDVSSKSGTTGQIETCSALAGSADPQWMGVQLKHVFAHRTGLPRSAISYNSVVLNYLDELRGLDSPADYAAQELLLRNDPREGDANVEAGRSALGWNTAFQADGSAEGYFTPKATLEEILLAVAGRCLPHPLGEYTYSNTDPGFTRVIMGHLTGDIYAADAGYPDLHDGSILQQFFDGELNMDTGSTDNIFAGAVAVSSGSDMPEPGPTARDWDDDATGVAQIYLKGWDRKRPHCIMGDDGCSFSAWASPSANASDPARAGRINWYWAQEQVSLPYYTNGGGAATGGLRVEALPFLKFLKNYWTGSYTSNPGIGQERNNVWSLGRSHNGSLGGGYAYAVQFGDSASCPGAAGVDVIVAVNQNTDKTGQSYGALYYAIRDAVCDVDWDEVEPYPFAYVAESAP